jgi:hypothetical protein
MSSFKTYTTIHNQSRPVNEDVIASSLYHDHDRFGDSGKQPEGSWSYPLSVKGFLYYFTKPDKPPLSGELRMRVTSSDDPASFESGSDFKKPNGQPWSRPLFVVSRSYTPLYEKLREERLVPDDLDAVLPTLHRRSPKGQFLYTLNDTFFVDFGADTYYITVLTEQGIEVLKVIGLFSEHRISDGKRQPYIGAYTSRYS